MFMQTVARLLDVRVRSPYFSFIFIFCHSLCDGLQVCDNTVGPLLFNAHRRNSLIGMKSLSQDQSRQNILVYYNSSRQYIRFSLLKYIITFNENTPSNNLLVILTILLLSPEKIARQLKIPSRAEFLDIILSVSYLYHNIQ